ncbi:hypothetical protein LTS18_014090, partial [Coniosporium uncinatum]
MNADGVVFFGTVGSGTKGTDTAQEGNAHSDESHTSSSDMPPSDRTTKRRRRATSSMRSSPSGEAHDVGQGHDSSARSSEPQDVEEGSLCEVIGLSTAPAEGNKAVLDEGNFPFYAKSMDRYIRRFPFGKFFSFTVEGSGISSGEENPNHGRKHTNDGNASLSGNSGAKKKQPKPKRERFIPTEILKILPGARGLIFLPLWDPTVERWAAGAFIWTSTLGRLMSPENELPYLKAFGNSIISQVARINAQKADKAKTTFIASISHELRSPLHGILGSVEFLHDTSQSAYQSSLYNSIENCGKTLLDTIEHVLDYAKINKLNKGIGRKQTEPQSRQSG